MTKHWSGGERARGVVSLTYDDGLPHHCEVVGPMLAERGFAGTFYVPVLSDLLERPEAWAALAAAGHELGNHSIFHPCRKEGGLKDLPWLDDGRDLRRYTVERWAEEVRVANGVLRLVDGRDSRSYGNTCHHETVGFAESAGGEGEISLRPVMREYFSAARGPRREQILRPDVEGGCDLSSLGCFKGDDRDFEGMKTEIDEAVACGGWIIYCMHGVGPAEHNLHIDAGVHERVLDYLVALGDAVWVAGVDEVARGLRPRES